MDETEQQRLDHLKMLVSVRVDEFLKLPDEEAIDIPYGDIEYELNQAARYVMRQVPRNISFFGSKSYDFGTVLPNEDNTGAMVPLPSDYLRFTRFKMRGWTRSVNSYMSDDTNAYQQQQFDMRRGTNEKPMAFLVPFDQKYDAGQAPSILCITQDTKATPHEGDVLKDQNDNTVATVFNVGDPDYIYISVDASSSYEAIIGNVLSHPQEGIDDQSYDLTIKYLEDDNYKRTSDSRQALEVYPLSKGDIEDFYYVPYMQAYDLPKEFEDVLVWRAVSTLLTSGRRFNDAEEALKQMAIAQQAINTGMYGERRMGNEQQ